MRSAPLLRRAELELQPGRSVKVEAPRVGGTRMLFSSASRSRRSAASTKRRAAGAGCPDLQLD